MVLEPEVFCEMGIMRVGSGHVVYENIFINPGPSTCFSGRRSFRRGATRGWSCARIVSAIPIH